MADMTFPCPLCQQPIACDEAWAGQQIQCPICHGNLTVPMRHDTGAASTAEDPLVPKPPPGGPKLSMGAAKAPPLHERAVPIRNLAPPPPKRKKVWVTIVQVAVTLLVLGVGGYYGYNWYLSRQKSAESAAAKPPADAEAPAPVKAPPPPPRVEPAVWTLDLDSAKIPNGPANGSVSSQKFNPKNARVDLVGAAQVLRLYEGQVASPDRDVLVYLQLKPGEKLGGQTLDISKTTAKPAGVIEVIKRWKANPQSPIQLKSFNTGYVLKLELGTPDAKGAIPGKIYLALPDPEQTVVAGQFKADTVKK
jgi:hypothetical protein